MKIVSTISMFIQSLSIRIRDYFKGLKKENLKIFFQEQILQTQDSNLRIASAIGFGIFMGIVPIWGFQTVAAIFIAAIFRLNKAIVVIATNISFPPIIPMVLYISFLTGGFLLNKKSNILFSKQFDLVNIKDDLLQYYLGALVLAILTGVIFWLISYFLLLLFRTNKTNSQM